MFIHIVNDQHRNKLEWDRAYEEGRQLVVEAHMRREERKCLRRRENLDSILAALGGVMITILIFIIMAIIVLIF